MKISARNQLNGIVRKVTLGQVQAEVTLELAGGQQLTATITRASAEALGLKEGSPAYAVIKSSSVLVAVD